MGLITSIAGFVARPAIAAAAPWLIGGAIAAVVTFAGFQVRAYGNRRAEAAVAPYVAAIAKQKAEAAATLATETANVLRLERALAEMTSKLEGIYELRRNESKAAQQRLADAVVRGGGRLRDPNAAGCGSSGNSAQGQSPASAGASSEGGGEAGGLFSEPATRLLQRITAESQEVNDAYALCRGWAIEVHDRMNAPP